MYDREFRRKMKDLVSKQLARSLEVLRKTIEDPSIAEALAEAGEVTAKAMRAGRKLMVAGNGGSAADAQHLAAEFVVRLTVHRPPLRAIALTTDTSILTAAGNDFSYESIFERQVEALGQKGDVFLAISTSGNSNNMLKALKKARQMEILTIGYTGNGGGAMNDLCDINVIVPSSVTVNIQEVHLVLEHILGMIVERSYFGPEFGSM
jgi:D-sedoheptulose 7-phosphate isomerase